jgi:hypothetical protein
MIEIDSTVPEEARGPTLPPQELSMKMKMLKNRNACGVIWESSESLQLYDTTFHLNGYDMSTSTIPIISSSSSSFDPFYRYQMPLLSSYILPKHQTLLHNLPEVARALNWELSPLLSFSSCS